MTSLLHHRQKPVPQKMIWLNVCKIYKMSDTQRPEWPLQGTLVLLPLRGHDSCLSWKDWSFSGLRSWSEVAFYLIDNSPLPVKGKAGKTG
jgi:hypothetical protein